MKQYKRTIIITSLITLAPIVLGLILWNKLPDTIATHWGVDGTANGWTSKTTAIIGLPIFLLITHLICVFATFNDPKKKNIHRKPLTFILWIVPLISVICNGATLMIAMGIDLSMDLIVSIVIGIMFIVLGNFMPKLQQNYTVGIKIPWTLNSVENWNRTHRFGGKVYIALGFAMMLMTLLDNLFGGTATVAIILIITIGGSMLPVAYSFYLYRKGI